MFHYLLESGVKKTDTDLIAFLYKLTGDLPGGCKLGIGRGELRSCDQVALFRGNMFQDSLSQDSLLEVLDVFSVLLRF